MFHEKGGFRKEEIKNIELGNYGPERNCLIKQIRINNEYIKKFTKMNLLLTHLSISDQRCIHVETNPLISRGH